MTESREPGPQRPFDQTNGLFVHDDPLPGTSEEERRRARSESSQNAAMLASGGIHGG